MKIKFKASAILVVLATFFSARGEIILLFFAAALIHEVGHLMAARILKKRISRIEIGFSGARIVIGDTLLGYGEELFVALMGPVFNLLTVGTIFWSFFYANMSPATVIEGGLAFLERGGSEWAEILGFVAVSSLAQAFLNLLPVKTLDGGRILYCIFASLLGERAGEIAVGIATAAVAFLSWTVALYLMLKVSAGLAVFVFAVWAFLRSDAIVKGEGEVRL